MGATHLYPLRWWAIVTVLCQTHTYTMEVFMFTDQKGITVVLHAINVDQLGPGDTHGSEVCCECTKDLGEDYAQLR